LSSSSTKKTDNSFKGRGFRFIPIRPAHLDFFAFVFGEAPPPWEECLGNTMVDEDFMPLGFCMAWRRENGTVTAHAYFGDWLRVYPKDILKGMRPVMQQIRDAGVTEIWAVADERVPGSDVLVKWFKGVPTGQIVPGQGEYYLMDITRSAI
jgi:hypothetical protein